MKSRDSNDSGGDRRIKGMNKKKKNEKRLGGKGLSLNSFANAKSRASGYDPSIIKKQREFYRNAKYVSKFKKFKRRECQGESSLSAAAIVEDHNEDEINRRPRANEKKKSLQALREEVEKKQAEANKAKMEREAMIKAKQEERASAEARRKGQKEKMFKKTRSGQPVMKYRIEHLLQGIVKDSAR